MTDPQVDAIQLSFIMQLSDAGGYPSMDIGTQKCTPFPGTNFGNCPELG